MKNRELLTKFLDNRCTVEEEQRVKHLLEQPDNLELLYQLIQERDAAAEQSDAAPDEQLAAKAKAWERQINERINATELSGKSAKRRLRSLSMPLILRYAAVFLGFILLASVLVWQANRHRTEQMSIAFIENTGAQGFPAKYVLPDNSQVYLAAGSKLSYPEDFAGNTREVQLEGEAFFDVTRNEARPFIIHTGDISTRVLGTSFRIKALADRSVVVSVATGKVSVSQQTDGEEKKLATLTPGDKVTWDAATQQSTSGSVDIHGLEQWKAGDLFFDEDSMVQIAAELQRRYGVTIHFADKALEAKRVSGSFTAGKPVEKIIYTLSLAGKFRFDNRDNKEFIIYSNN